MAPQFQNRAFQRSERMSDVKGESNSLAKQELARQNLLLGGVGKLVGELCQPRVQSFSLAAEEQARFEEFGRWVRHDGVGDEESAQKDGGSRSNLGGETAEDGGADQLDGEELEQLRLLGRREELGQRFVFLAGVSHLDEAAGNVRLGSRVCFLPQFRKPRGGE